MAGIDVHGLENNGAVPCVLLVFSSCRTNRASLFPRQEYCYRSGGLEKSEGVGGSGGLREKTEGERGSDGEKREREKGRRKLEEENKIAKEKNRKKNSERGKGRGKIAKDNRGIEKDK